MIPDEEQSRLFDTVIEAVERGAAGEALDGYRRLDLGLAWAETWRSSGASWGEELADRYRRALVRFAEEFGLAWREAKDAAIHLPAASDIRAPFADEDGPGLPGLL
jgi:hypothetical protein